MTDFTRRAHGPIQRIVDAVCEVLADEGVVGLSMRKVAEKASATIGLITHHFPTRNAMVLAAVEATWDKEHKAAELPPAGVDREAVLASLRAFLPLDESRRRELSVWLAFWALSQTSRELQSVHSNIHRTARDNHARWIERLGYSTDTAARLADRLILTNDGLLLYALLDETYWTAERQQTLMESAVDEIFRSAPSNSEPNPVIDRDSLL